MCRSCQESKWHIGVQCQEQASHSFCCGACCPSHSKPGGAWWALEDTWRIWRGWWLPQGCALDTQREVPFGPRVALQAAPEQESIPRCSGLRSSHPWPGRGHLASQSHPSICWASSSLGLPWPLGKWTRPELKWGQDKNARDPRGSCSPQTQRGPGQNPRSTPG